MSLVRSLLTVAALLLVAGAAHAQVGCVPNPNLTGPPFVNGCPLPASALNGPNPWSAVVHQNAGGEVTGHQYLMGDQHATVLADHFQLEAPNPGIAGCNITGAAAPTSVGQKPGCAVTLNGVIYTVTYQVQPSDTTLILINTGLQNCLANDTGTTLSMGQVNIPAAANCTSTPSSLTNALLALTPKYYTAAGNAALGQGVNFDLPIPQATNLAGVSTANLTATPFPNGSLSGLTLDNGPHFAAVTYNQGRVPLAGDFLGFFRMDGQSTGGNIDTSYAGMAAQIVSPTQGATIGRLRLNATQGGNPGAVTSMAVSRGVVTQDGTGTGVLLTDLGPGSMHAVAETLDNQLIVGGGANSSTVNQGSVVVTSNSTNTTSLALGNTSTGGTNWFMQSEGSAHIAGQFDIEDSGTGNGLHVAKTTGHVFSDGYLRSAAAKPAASACGTGPTINGNAQAGTVIPGTGSPTACTLTWATSFTQTATCVFEVVTTTGVTHAITGQTSTFVTVAFSASPAQFNYVCLD